MIKLCFSFLTLLFIGQVFCQSTDMRPSRSRFYNNRYNSFPVKENDILIYNLKSDSTQYDVIVRVEKDSNDRSLSYSIKELNKAGNILLPAKTLSEAYKYDTLITDSMARLKNEIVFWMSKKNYKELYYIKESEMDMGNGKETFTRGNTSVIKLKVKGRESIYTLYNMGNTNNEAQKSITVLTNLGNPLVVKLDTGKWLMTLKEVR